MLILEFYRRNLRNSRCVYYLHRTSTACERSNSYKNVVALQTDRMTDMYDLKPACISNKELSQVQHGRLLNQLFYGTYAWKYLGRTTQRQQLTLAGHNGRTILL